MTTLQYAELALAVLCFSLAGWLLGYSATCRDAMRSLHKDKGARAEYYRGKLDGSKQVLIALIPLAAAVGVWLGFMVR